MYWCMVERLQVIGVRLGAPDQRLAFQAHYDSPVNPDNSSPFSIYVYDYNKSTRGVTKKKLPTVRDF